MRRLLAAYAAGCGSSLAAGDEIRTLTLLSRPQAAQPQEFQAAQLVAQEWRKLGLDVDVKVMPWEQMADLVWYQREDWDMTSWQMVGRPERSDPDEFIYNLYDSSTAEKGYNFVGYINPDYDKIAEAQRAEVDKDKRQKLVFEAQDIIFHDQPTIMLVHPKTIYAYRSDIWEPSSVVEQKGIGIKNFWTFDGLTPKGDQKDIILNSADTVKAINPLYISGSTDSWITELLWDRLMRVGPDSLPEPWAAKSVDWVDNTTLDVTLRDGMTFSDGTPVTPEDVIFSFTAPAGDEVPMYKPFVTNIASVEQTGDNTIRFKLQKPAASFLTSTLAKVNIVPKHVWEPILEDLATKPENAESYQEDMPVGSGPFKFVSWRNNEEVVLEANPDHFSAPKAERWILRIIPNVEAALGMLKSGDLNFLSDYNGDPKVLDQMASEDPNITTVAAIDLGFRYIGLNNRRPPFDDAAFRRALSAATNRALIAAAGYNGYAVPATSVISPVLTFWSNPDLKADATGTDAAKKILEDAGYTVVDGRLHYPDGEKETLAN